MTDRIAETDKLLKEVKQENEQLNYEKLRFNLGDYSNGLQEIRFDDDYIIVEQKSAQKLCDLLNEMDKEIKKYKK